MSLNTAHANGGVLIFNGEIILLYCNGVELAFEGNDAKNFTGSNKGRIYLTTHRMIFINKTEKNAVQSFSFPFFSMSSLELEQPIFGANYIKGSVHAQPNGNWTGKAVFKLKFFTGGAIEFGQAMRKAAQMASRYMTGAPPPYTPQQGPFYPAAPPAYMVPGEGVAGFVPPTHVFPEAPPANSVYTSDMPPPYPGIYPPAYYPPSGQPQFAPTGNPEMPPPPGFMGNTNAGAAAAAPPPPYYNGPTAPDFAPSYWPNNETTPQSQDSKSGYTSTQTGYRVGTDGFYVPQQNMNGTVYYPNDPPPPYASGEKKKEQ